MLRSIVYKQPYYLPYLPISLQSTNVVTVISSHLWSVENAIFVAISPNPLNTATGLPLFAWIKSLVDNHFLLYYRTSTIYTNRSLQMEATNVPEWSIAIRVHDELPTVPSIDTVILSLSHLPYSSYLYQWLLWLSREVFLSMSIFSIDDQHRKWEERDNQSIYGDHRMSADRRSDSYAPTQVNRPTKEYSFDWWYRILPLPYSPPSI